ncbi:flavin reductase family protein [Fervidobacterium thailandense]|nr:flavin reductase family protein [Fervidobacterium thailandense]
MKKFSKNPSKFYFHYPFPVAVVGVKVGDVVNFMSAAWHTQLSFDPPLYGVAISPKRFTSSLLEKAHEFSLNFLDFKDYRLAGTFGRLSGREVDKSRIPGGEWTIGNVLNVPILERAVAVYECKLVKFEPLGDHVLYVGQILGVHYDEDYFNTGVGRSTLLYMGNDLYSCAHSVNSVSFTKEDALRFLNESTLGRDEQ